jgi:hypothetical protein
MLKHDKPPLIMGVCVFISALNLLCMFVFSDIGFYCFCIHIRIRSAFSSIFMYPYWSYCNHSAKSVSLNHCSMIFLIQILLRSFQLGRNVWCIDTNILVEYASFAFIIVLWNIYTKTTIWVFHLPVLISILQIAVATVLHVTLYI